jgi:hypothetical protein
VIAKFLQTLLGGTKSENLTPNKRHDDPQFDVCGLCAGRTYGHNRSCGTTATTAKLNGANHRNRYIDSAYDAWFGLSLSLPSADDFR